MIISESFRYCSNGELCVTLVLDSGCLVIIHHRFLNEVEKAKLEDYFIRKSLSEITKKEIM